MNGVILLNFGGVLLSLKHGFCARRQDWKPNTFVFMQVPAEIPLETIPKMQSLPEPVKAELAARNLPLRYSNQFALVGADNSINGWTPSPADVLAEDWVVLESNRPRLAPHQQRVVDERADLEERREKLRAFIESSPVFDTLPEAERERLFRQHSCMADLTVILTQRINAGV